MIARQTFKALFTLFIGLGSVGFAGSAAAQSQPSAKATFGYGPLISLPSGCSTTSTLGCTAENGWKPILTQQIKLANQKDLFIGASLQCGIVTDTTVRSKNGTEDSTEARGTIRVKIEITPEGGTPVYAQPSSGSDANGATATDGVVFCDRVQTLLARFSGLNCKVNATTGYVECADPEELRLILKTLNATAFNFVAPDLGSGVHTIRVMAKSSASATPTTDGSLGAANSFIGAGSVSVESVRMIKGEVTNVTPVPID